MLVTKHCEPKYWESLHAGHVLVGALSNYRSIESESGLLDDRQEGTSVLDVDGDLVNFSGSIGALHMTGFTAIGYASAIHVEHHTDANVFCVSAGGYSLERHRALIQGTANYKANPSCTAFIEYDLEKLEYAMRYLASLRFGCMVPIVSGLISYGGRTRTILAINASSELSDSALEHAQSAVFMKPPRFECEQEHRIAFNVGAPLCTPIFTSSLARNIRRNFSQAVSNKGAILSHSDLR